MNGPRVTTGGMAQAMGPRFGAVVSHVLTYGPGGCVVKVQKFLSRWVGLVGLVVSLGIMFGSYWDPWKP